MLLYARAAVPEFWLVDLAGESIEVYRQSGAEGYQDVQLLRRGQRVACQSLPGLELAVGEIMG
jgi:Uma2 family endonuclease